ncbi:hypothetical protein Agub_g9245 [Astrephomene gubernaculifera]|uniref:ACT domain-containing protein n=1 Tax=Astrephomene gubernaculifera TaxID=47775 RepID=A0AAD3HNS5_9CHLO|nr:hypothetical protein Agub_g9245 [Astrephomene gubernaculifera]
MLVKLEMSQQMNMLRQSGCNARYRAFRLRAPGPQRHVVAMSLPDNAVPLPYPAAPEIQAKLFSCTRSTVTVDNSSHPRYTVITVKAPDTPGLVRVLSWVLNGMSVRVQHGTLASEGPEGGARDTLWVTDFRGRKLRDSSAASLGSRLEDFLVVCGGEEAGEGEGRQEWQCGSIEVSNRLHPDMTQVIIRGEPSAHKPGFLLELASALTGVGAVIVAGGIQGGPDAPCPEAAVAEPGYDFSAGRYFKFLLKGPTGGQMDADRVASLLFVLRLLQGRGTMPTVAPNMQALLKLDSLA